MLGHDGRMVGTGVGVVSVFGPEEFAERLEKVQQRMAERGWLALVVADPANLYYLTGHNAWSSTHPSTPPRSSRSHWPRGSR